MKYECENKTFLIERSIISDAYPMTQAFVLYKPVANRIGIVQNRITKGFEVVQAIMEMMVGHLRVTKRAIIGLGLFSRPFDLRYPVKTGVDDMDLSTRVEIVLTHKKDPLERREVFDGCREDDYIETPAFQYA